MLRLLPASQALHSLVANRLSLYQRSTPPIIVLKFSL